MNGLIPTSWKVDGPQNLCQPLTYFGILYALRMKISTLPPLCFMFYHIHMSPKKNIRDPTQHKVAQGYSDFPTKTSMQVQNLD